MSDEYVVEAVHQEGMAFECKTAAHAVTLDYPMKPGEKGMGPRPLEMLLASLAACVGGGLAAILARSGQRYSHLAVRVRGVRQVEHPTVFRDIDVQAILTGVPDPETAQRCFAQAEKICPVWVMLRSGTKVTAELTIQPEQGTIGSSKLEVGSRKCM